MLIGWWAAEQWIQVWWSFWLLRAPSSSINITWTGAASDMRPNSSDFLLQDERVWCFILCSETRSLLAAGQKISGVIETDTRRLFSTRHFSETWRETMRSTASAAFRRADRRLPEVSLKSAFCYSQTVWRVESNRWTLFCSDEFINLFQTKN